MAKSRIPLKWSDEDFNALVEGRQPTYESTPIDDSGPRYQTDEPRPEAWTRFFIALAAFALLEAAIHAAGVMWFLSRFGN